MRAARSLTQALAWASLLGLFVGPLAAGELQASALFEALKAGGNVIYIRHAKTNLELADRNPVVIGDCSTQRPLSDDGRRQAKQIGENLRAMGAHIDRVLSSPYCRTMETAELAFPDIKGKAASVLHYSLGLPKDDAQRAADELKKVLATVPRTGANTVLVGHTSNLKEAAGLWPKKEGAALVFRPDGRGAFVFVGSLEPTDFAKPGS